MKKFYLVVGGESTGTKLMTRVLVESGCKGDDGDKQRLDRETKESSGTKVLKNGSYVWRRSFPHNRKWYDLIELYRSLQKAGGFQSAEGMVVVMNRNFPAAAQSQVSRGHIDKRVNAYYNLKKAYKEIFKGLEKGQFDFTVVSYDLLTASPELYLPILLNDLEIACDVTGVAYSRLIYSIKDKNTERLVDELLWRRENG